MKGFTKNPIGRDIEYVLDADPRVTVIRDCYCSFNCGSTWMIRFEDDLVDSGHYSYFKDAIADAIALGSKSVEGE